MNDELADLPPEEFVVARDALAKALKAAGKLTEAAEVKQLKRPTVPAWVAEQVRRHHDDALDALRIASRAVADAQEAAITSGDREAMRTATARRKDAIRALGTVVEQVLARNGRPAHHRDEVLGALEAAVTEEVAGGTFGLRDDIELPARAEPKRDVAAEKRAAEAARKEIDRAEARVSRARDALDDAERDLAAVVERHAGVERDA